MAIDAVFPAASELVMLYGGALASGALTHNLDVFGWRTTGTGAFVAIALAGTIGYQVGAVGGWLLGIRGGRSLLERRGKWLHLNEEQLGRAERWFDRWEGWAVLVGRVTPIARSFISIPAGVFGTPFPRYFVLTLVGNAIWCFGLAGAGWGLGASWRSVDHGFRYADYVVVAGIVLIAAYLVVRRRRSTTMARRVPDSAR
ncbi:MAG: DedA family protein [Actinobacteria bacterium]|nr:DedA family protein [Actinomycetota bacterium]